MDSLHLICPHCGLKMEVFLKGKPSSMMVFVCARCKEPLMRYEGEVFELDREEFGMLRKKLAPVIAELLNESNQILSLESQAETSAVAHVENIGEKNSEINLTEEFLADLMNELEKNQDVADFIEKM